MLINRVDNYSVITITQWSDVRKALEESEKVFNERLEEQVRLQVWIRAARYSAVTRDHDCNL